MSEVPKTRTLKLTIQQLYELFSAHTWANFDPNGVSDSAEIFDVCTRKLPCSITDPEEMRRGIIVCGWFCVGDCRESRRGDMEFSCQRLLVIEQQPFVTRQIEHNAIHSNFKDPNLV